MFPLHHAGVWPLFLFILKGVSCDELTPDQTAEFSVEGSTVTLSYKFSRTMTGSDYFFWYRQNPGQAPEFLLYISGLNVTRRSDSLKSETRFFTHLSGDDVKLHISSAAVKDSAVYYCAVRPNAGGNKMVFGSGTRLTIEPRDDYEPSYYELGDVNGTIKACLATGFSRSNATLENDLFKNSNSSRAVRASGDSLHSEVLLLSGNHTGKCEIDENESVVCVETLDKDVTVNTVSLLVVALRLLFIKTVVFNVLMTLRLWLRH